MEPTERWSEVVRRRPEGMGPQRRGPTPEELKRKLPRSEAIVIGPLPDGTSYGVAMKKAIGAVNLSALGVTVDSSTRTRNGAVLLQLKCTPAQADEVAAKLRGVLGSGIRVGRPSRKASILILDVQEWVEAEELQAAIRAVVSEGPAAGLQDEVPLPVITRSETGTGGFGRMAVPMKVAVQLAAVKKIRVNWSTCRIRIPEDKGPRCFRCLQRGHMATGCKGQDRSGCCFRCHETGHKAKDCQGPVARGKRIESSEEGRHRPAPSATTEDVGVSEEDREQRNSQSTSGA